jgi:hypothetical protein
MASIDAFCTVVDDVMDFRVIGGEVFINRDWHHVVRRLVDEPKARRVVLYTNGTLMPDKGHLTLLQQKKVLVIATDYGSHSRKLGELCGWFRENEIAHHVLAIDAWLDCATIEMRDRSHEETNVLYQNCCAKNMPTLSNGKLFNCPYAANADRLSAIPNNQRDYVNILEMNRAGTDRDVVREQVRSSLWRIDYLETCRFCSSRPLSGTTVPPATQTKQSLPYRKYS